VGQWTFVGIPETEEKTPFGQSNPLEVFIYFSSPEQDQPVKAAPVGKWRAYKRLAGQKDGAPITDSCPFDDSSTVCVKSITQDNKTKTITIDLLETVNGWVGGG
jgi:hypothetical protein